MGHLAGRGPKCLLKLNGESLLAHQHRNLHAAGVSDITVVTGYGATHVEALGVCSHHHPEWAKTNMVASMFSAESHFGQARAPVLVHYGDVVIEPRHLEALAADRRDVVCLLDEAWQPYFESRGPHWRADVEALRLAPDNRVARFGAGVATVDEAEARFVGAMRFSAACAQRVFHRFRQWLSAPAGSGAPEGDPRLLDCTSFLQCLIEAEEPVGALLVQGGWLELDCAADYHQARTWVAEGRLPFMDGQAALGLPDPAEVKS